MAVVFILAGCRSEKPPGEDGDDVDDTSTDRPLFCGEGPIARELYGDAPSDVIGPGTTLLAETMGQGQSGMGLTLGLTAISPTPNVAWRADLVDVATELRVGGAAPYGYYAFSALLDWSEDTCTGHLPGLRVCLGDCMNGNEFCDLDGQTLRVQATTTTIGESANGEAQLGVQIVLDASAQCLN